MRKIIATALLGLGLGGCYDDGYAPTYTYPVVAPVYTAPVRYVSRPVYVPVYRPVYVPTYRPYVYRPVYRYRR